MHFVIPPKGRLENSETHLVKINVIYIIGSFVKIEVFKNSLRQVNSAKELLNSF